MNTNNQTQGFIANPQIFLSRDGDSLIHLLPGEMRIELPVNLYKKVLGVEFSPKEKVEGRQPMQKAKLYGFTAKPSLFLSQDGEYLIHRVLNVKITRHVNYYKKVLGIEFQPKTEPVSA